MKEAWYALALALTAKPFLLPEDALQSLHEGRITRERRVAAVVVPEIIALKSDGMTWREIDQMYGYAKKTAACMAHRYRKRLEKANHAC